jgi:hypothetical protein
MLSLYIGVYRALYDYVAQADEELSIQAGDLLYLLEKSDLDEWWKVKKRVIADGNEEVDEPQGLVPNNYIEVAPVVKQCLALYDYDKQTEEELTFKEGDRFNVYDLNDPDWFLVGDSTNQQFGFVPSNYLQLDLEAGALTATFAANQPVASQPQYQPVQQQALPPLPHEQKFDPSAFAPPPTHYSRTQPSADVPSEPRATLDVGDLEEPENVDEDEAPPPMPTRPRSDTTESKGAPSMEKEEDLATNPEHEFDGEYFTWYIHEIDSRYKKKAVILSIGNGKIMLKPNIKNKQILRATSSMDYEWKIRDLINFNHEKKHVFLEFKNPTLSVELHTGTKDVSDAIMSILGDLKGADSATGLREVEQASKASTNANNRKIGRLLFDFIGQGSDELTSREGENVYIINDVKSKDWWMCQNTETGKQGVIPSSYIEIVGTSNLDKLTATPQRKKSVKSSKGKVVDHKNHDSHRRHRTRDEREKIREKDRAHRDKLSSKHSESDKSMPNYHRVRTWIDSSGSFKVEAEFLGCVEGKIHLHKTNGVKIAVGATKLSIEDLEYVEKVTGTSLESYKEEVNKQLQMKSSRRKSGVMTTDPSPTKGHSATAAINDISPSTPSKSKATTQLSTSESDYDWFEFFLQCGVDIGNCQRYSLNFGREQMDENILEDISPSLLRTLGLREGDIIRVMKYLDKKFDRKKASAEEAAPTGGLFTEPTGALKNNSSTTEASKVDANALPSPQKQAVPLQPSYVKLDDDAWVVKPAARSNEDLSKPAPQPQPQAPQYTGSLQDLVNIKPFDPNASKPTPADKQPSTVEPSAPALTPVKTGTLAQPGQQYTVAKPGIVQGQATGGLVPVRTGGLIPVQPTGFIPIQPTGFIPIQPTGGLQPQLTFGIVPLQTGTFTIQKTGGQATGGVPPTSFGQPIQPVLQNGTVTIPATSFNQPLSLQQTGPLIPTQRTGGNPFPSQPVQSFPTQLTGGLMNQVPNQLTGGLPQTSFNSAPVSTQITGGFVPQSTFGKQVTGGFMNTQTGGNMPPTTFGVPPPNSFGSLSSPPTFTQQPGFGQQSTFNQQPTFGQQTTFNQQPVFGQQPTFNQQPTFGQQGFEQSTFGQPDVNSLGNMFQNTGISGPLTFNNTPMNNTFTSQPTNTFGQQAQNVSQPFTSFGQVDAFSNQPLQSQPTGAGFGNAPLQSQQTGGRKANLFAATPDNPFGY